MAPATSGDAKGPILPHMVHPVSSAGGTWSGGCLGGTVTPTKTSKGNGGRWGPHESQSHSVSRSSGGGSLASASASEVSTGGTANPTCPAGEKDSLSPRSDSGHNMVA